MKIVSLLSTILISLSVFAQIPENRIVDWSTAGLYEDVYEDIQSVNISDFGGFPDDGLNDNQAFIDAMASFLGEPGKVLFSDGVYNFDTQVQLSSGLILEGNGYELTTLSFNLDSEVDLIAVSGSIGTTESVVGNATKGNNYIVLDSDMHDFVSGDLLKLQMDGESFMFSEWAYSSMAQIIHVESIVEDTLFIVSELRHDFASEFNPRVIKIEPVRDVVLKNFKIIREDETTQQTTNIRFTYAFNCNVRAIESESCNFSHLSVRSSTNIEVSGCYFHHAFNYGEGGQGYGTEVSAASGECLIENNIFEHLRHSILFQSGANGNVAAYNYSFDPYWDQGIFPAASAGDLVLHGNYTYCNLFEGNIAQNVVIDDSHDMNGPYNTFFRNRLEKYGIVMNFNPATDYCNIVGNEITNTGFLLGNYTLYGNDHFEYGNNHKGSCEPSGTTDLSEHSLYLENAPCYFYDEFQLPGVGYPNTLEQYSIPAKDRYQDDVMTFDTCETIISNVHDSELKSLFYPNPSSGELFFDNGSDICSVQIFDESAKLVSEFIVNDEKITFDIPSGFYIIKIRYRNGDLLYRKLIVR